MSVYDCNNMHFPYTQFRDGPQQQHAQGEPRGHVPPINQTKCRNFSDKRRNVCRDKLRIFTFEWRYTQYFTFQAIPPTFINCIPVAESSKVTVPWVGSKQKLQRCPLQFHLQPSLTSHTCHVASVEKRHRRRHIQSQLIRFRSLYRQVLISPIYASVLPLFRIFLGVDTYRYQFKFRNTTVMLSSFTP